MLSTKVFNMMTTDFPGPFDFDRLVKEKAQRKPPSIEKQAPPVRGFF